MSDIDPALRHCEAVPSGGTDGDAARPYARPLTSRHEGTYEIAGSVAKVTLDAGPPQARPRRGPRRRRGNPNGSGVVRAYEPRPVALTTSTRSGSRTIASPRSW